MVAQQHYQRLKHLYSAASSEHATGPVDISYGYAEVVGAIDGETDRALVPHVPHQQLLADVASLAAGSVEKEGRLSLERFNMSVSQPDYQGSVQANAEVVLAEPPRYHVRATLFGEDGNEIAEALAFFEPSGEALPPIPPRRPTPKPTGPRRPPPPSCPST